jgi:hypothetical protein
MYRDDYSLHYFNKRYVAFMSLENNYISGWKTQQDWSEFSQGLTVGQTPEKWKVVASIYFMPRLELRYLRPIKILRDNDTSQGEGFSIMAILCSLIEFLESTCQGKIYKYAANLKELNENEYSGSKKMFTDFLVNREPFSKIFDVELANEFYSSIRCGLLHEASTKNGWRIWAESSSENIIDFKNKIVFRNDFEAAIRGYIASYTEALPEDSAFQQAFLVKWASL